MIYLNNPEHFTKVMQFALNNNCAVALVDALMRAGRIGVNCYIYEDFAPHSFGFATQRDDGSPYISGGVIYSGPGQPLDGSGPAFTVGIGINSSKHGWSVHT